MTTDSDRLEEIKERFEDFKEGSTLQYNVDMAWLIARVEELEGKLAEAEKGRRGIFKTLEEQFTYTGQQTIKIKKLEAKLKAVINEIKTFGVK